MRLREPHGGGDPAGVAAHHLEDEDLGRGLGHRLHVEARLAHAGGHVLGHRAEARAVVGDRQVVVDRLGHVHGDERIAHLGGDARDLEAGVGGIVAAVVEEVADVVRLEHLDQALVLVAALLDALELVAAGAEGAARRVHERADVRGRLAAGVDEVLGERADDAVAARVDLADLRLVLPRRLDDARGARVDHRGDAAGLRVEGVAGHGGA